MAARGALVTTLAVWMLTAPLGASEADAPVYAKLDESEAIEFLRQAEIVDRESIPIGVAKPVRLTLSDGERTVRAVWKSISEYRPIRRFDDGGPPELGFRDSWQSEVAAYELDRMLGFGLVPPTTERRIRRTDGSIQLWIEGAMTEGQRRRREIAPPDLDAWSQQVFAVRLFHQLIYDADYMNLSNLLVDEEFRLWVIDNSRAFRTQGSLLNTKYLRRFSRRLVDALRGLTAERLEERLGDRLTRGQREGLLKRRDLIFERVEQLISEKGEDAVLY